jgi:1,4-alpha-glucan branching enzyme
MKNTLLLIVVLAFFQLAKAQIITTTPSLPTDNDEVTVVFDATEGNGSLAGFSGDVYAHTGVITSNSTGDSDWKYVIAEWSENTEKAKMTSLGDDKYQIVLTPSIREFYGVPDGETIEKIAFVFRNSDGSLQGKTASGGDIFADVYEVGLAISITSPTTQPYFVDESSNFDITIEGSEATSVVIKIDETTVHTETASPNSFTYNVTQTTAGTHELVVEATDGSETLTEKFIYVTKSTATVETLPANVRDGINYIDDNTVTLVLHAPYKNSVYAFGSFNDWQPVAMKKTMADVNDPELRYWITLTGLTASKEYLFQYLIDEELKIADPYTEKISDPWNDKYIDAETYPDLIAYPEGKTDGVVATFQTAQTGYTWQTTDFSMPKKEDLVIYELLVRDFAAKANYQTLIDTIGYFKRLGINAIELMPTNEFEGNSSWGYNPAFYFAPDKAYGTKNKMKEFIDVCHQNGIAVIIDLVLNHSYGLSPFVQMYFNETTGKPTAQNPWYNVEHNFQNTDAHWGYDFNHESEYTKALVDSINSFWLSEYKVDGFRFDFTKGFSNTSYGPSDWGSAYDADRISILKRMADEIWKRNPDAYVSFEHLSDNTEETELANYGIYLWGNMNHNYNEATMGFTESNKSDLSGASYKSKGWDDPNLVAYMESHDEERLMYKNQQYGNSEGDYDTKNLWTALARYELAACFFFPIPGPKMIWQFGELGYDISINDPGRVDPKPIKWDYYDENSRYRLFQVFSSLIKLKKEQDVFETTDYAMDVTGAAKRINLNGTDMNVTIIGNFDVEEADIDPNFQETGTWYDYFSGESIDVTDVNASITLAPGEYHIYTSVQLETPDIIADVKQVENAKVSNIQLRTFPNPATENVQIEFALEKKAEKAEICIFNLTGQKISTLFSGDLPKGQHLFNWQLDNSQGTKVAKGMYLLKISSIELNNNAILIVD